MVGRRLTMGHDPVLQRAASGHGLAPLRAPLDLPATLQSGQAFRWRLEGGWWCGVIGGHLVHLRQAAEGLEFHSSPHNSSDVTQTLRDYLRLDDDLEEVYRLICRDERMAQAIACYRGLRLLRQAPWECLVAFMCSTNSSVARISATMEALATTYGEPLSLGAHVRHAFPSSQALASAGEAGLRATGLGFRAKYVAKAAQMVTDGQLDLKSLRSLPYQDARERLLTVPGVGDKVADCVLLFSLDKGEAFPVDRWVRRAVEDWYPEVSGWRYQRLREWALERFGEHAGYAQQYIFHYWRLKAKEQ